MQCVLGLFGLLQYSAVKYIINTTDQLCTLFIMTLKLHFNFIFKKSFHLLQNKCKVILKPQVGTFCELVYMKIKKDTLIVRISRYICYLHLKCFRITLNPNSTFKKSMMYLECIVCTYIEKNVSKNHIFFTMNCFEWILYVYVILCFFFCLPVCRYYLVCNYSLLGGISLSYFHL